MGYLVFTRLYFHLLADELEEYQEDKDSLLQYMAGIADSDDIYRPFPGALLSIRFITEVGYLICSHGVEEPNKQTDNAEKTSDQKTSEVELNTSLDSSVQQPVNVAKQKPVGDSSVPSTIHDVSPTLWHALDVWRSTQHRGTGLQQALQGLSLCGTGLAKESWLDVSIAFRVLSEAAKQERSVLHTLQNLGAGILTRPAALKDIHAQHIDLCDQCLSRMTENNLDRTPRERAINDDVIKGHVRYSASSGSAESRTPSLVRGIKKFAGLEINDKPDIDAQSEDSEMLRSRSDRSETSSEASFADVSSVDSMQDDASRKKSPLSRRERKSRSNLRNTVTHGDFSSDSEEDADRTEKKHVGYGARTAKSAPDGKHQTSISTRQNRAGTGVRFSINKPQEIEISMETGDNLHHKVIERRQTRESLYSGQTGSSVTLPVTVEGSSREASFARTDTAVLPDGLGILGWRWELAYSYAECMATVCLHGNTSVIQKSALVGSEPRTKKLMYAGKVTSDKTSLGLVGLLNLKYTDKEVENVNRDWSWRVRFAAVHGLVRVCRHSQGDSNKEGIRTVAWGALLKHHSVEKDVRVLEALKVANAEVDLEVARNPSEISEFSRLSSYLAAGLAAVLLPSLPSPVSALPAQPRIRSRVDKVPVNKPFIKREQKRPSLRQEILLANATQESPVDYATRMNHQLLTVIDDQWKKELHEMEEEENKERQLQAEQQIKELAAIEKKKTQENAARKEKRAQAQLLRSTNM